MIASSRIAMLVFVALAMFAFAACRQPETPDADATPNATTSAPTTAAPKTVAVDDADWSRSDAWRAIAPCRAQASMIYGQVGGRLRGRTLEQQMQGYATRDDLGPDKAGALLRIRKQLEKIYAAPEELLHNLGSNVAAECIAATPQAGADRERAFTCFLQHQDPLMQQSYVNETSPSGDIANAADHAFYRCLRGG
jgi:hypothetical protein